MKYSITCSKGAPTTATAATCVKYTYSLQIVVLTCVLNMHLMDYIHSHTVWNIYCLI